MSLRATVRRTFAYELVRAEWQRAPVEVCAEAVVLGNFTAVRVPYVVNPADDERPTCRFC